MNINKEILMTIVKNSSNYLEGEQEILKINEKQLNLISKEISQLFSLYGVVASEKTFNIHECINEISKDASRRGVLVYDLSKDNSFRYNCKKAIDKMLYKK
jgi:hypothetical protein